MYSKYIFEVHFKYNWSTFKVYFKNTSSILQPIELEKEKYTSIKEVHLKHILWNKITILMETWTVYASSIL